MVQLKTWTSSMSVYLPVPTGPDQTQVRRRFRPDVGSTSKRGQDGREEPDSLEVAQWTDETRVQTLSVVPFQRNGPTVPRSRGVSRRAGLEVPVYLVDRVETSGGPHRAGGTGTVWVERRKTTGTGIVTERVGSPRTGTLTDRTRHYGSRRTVVFDLRVEEITRGRDSRGCHW